VTWLCDRCRDPFAEEDLFFLPRLDLNAEVPLCAECVVAHGLDLTTLRRTMDEDRCAR
jgi:hypothetical protein